MITDVSMPQLDGLELATKVKEQHPGTSVVLITGNAMSDFIESAVSVGISKVFPKPLDLQIFLPFIRSLLLEGQSYVHGKRPLDQGFQIPVG
jgi:two-component system, response regulator YesN